MRPIATLRIGSQYWEAHEWPFEAAPHLARARWEQAAAQDSPHSLVESATLGWVNVLLSALWGPVLEKNAAGQTAGVLQRTIAEVCWCFVFGC